MASVGYDPADNATALVPPSSMGIDYSAALYGGSLKGKRLGLVLPFFNRTESDETTPANDVMDSMVADLEGSWRHYRPH